MVYCKSICPSVKIILPEKVEESWKDPHRRKPYDFPICDKNCVSVLRMNSQIEKSFTCLYVKNLFVKKWGVMEGPTQKKTIWLSNVWQGFHQCFNTGEKPFACTMWKIILSVEKLRSLDPYRNIWLPNKWQELHQCFKKEYRRKAIYWSQCEKSVCQKKMSYGRNHKKENHMTVPYVTRFSSMF